MPHSRKTRRVDPALLVAAALISLLADASSAQTAVYCKPFMPAYKPCDASGAVLCSAFWPHGDVFVMSTPPCNPASQIKRQIDADLRAVHDNVNSAVFNSELQTLRYVLGHLGEYGVAFWVVMKNTSDKPISFRLPVLIGRTAHGDELRRPHPINGEEFVSDPQLYADLAADYPAPIAKSAWRAEPIDLQPGEVSARNFKYPWTSTKGLDKLHVLALFSEAAMTRQALDAGDLLAIGAQEFFDRAQH